MTRLLLNAIARLQKLPAQLQDEIAVRILEDLGADERWEHAFAGTTDDEWKALLREIDRAIDQGVSTSLDEFLRA
ncbi:MAG: hypothetical protein SH809_04045 [Rhodothermales bacterium]|nr:hypothetical protein [Rhodothermales bacterium]